MKLETTRFGVVEVTSEDLLTFPEGLPGFDEKRFALVPSPVARRVIWLQSVSDPDLAVMTVDPHALGLDFEPRFKSGETQVVQPDAGALECRVVASPGPEGRVLLNLFAPLVINRVAGLAAQLPLVGSGHTTHVAWPPEEPRDTVPSP